MARQKKNYVYVIVSSSKEINYLYYHDCTEQSFPCHSYSKETWRSTSYLPFAHNGTSSRPPRKRYGDYNVISIEVAKIQEYIEIHNLMLL
jgi:hypothetical protein